MRIERTAVSRSCASNWLRCNGSRAKGEAEGTHIFERDAPWTLGLAHRSTERKRKRERDHRWVRFVHKRVKPRSRAVRLARGVERSRRGSGSSGSFSVLFENGQPTKKRLPPIGLGR